MITRRNLLQIAGAGALAGGLVPRAFAQGSAPTAPSGRGVEPAAARQRYGYVPVHTLNGWTLPYRMNNGVKEFHLIAEAFE
ncbi:MAG: copper oxidase, partial [Vicinamibacterales bacterium]